MTNWSCSRSTARPTGAAVMTSSSSTACRPRTGARPGPSPPGTAMTPSPAAASPTSSTPVRGGTSSMCAAAVRTRSRAVRLGHRSPRPERHDRRRLRDQTPGLSQSRAGVVPGPPLLPPPQDYRVTRSQSLPTLSRRSAMTRSRPEPQRTMSREVSRELMMSLPGPPLSVSRPAPPVRRSAPLPPLIVSLPEPPLRRSLPPPPLILSLPLPPVATSLPEPPSIVSLPVPPSRVSLPEPPSMRSEPGPPAMRSAPEPPSARSLPSPRLMRSLPVPPSTTIVARARVDRVVAAAAVDRVVAGTAGERVVARAAGDRRRHGRGGRGRRGRRRHGRRARRRRRRALVAAVAAARRRLPGGDAAGQGDRRRPPRWRPILTPLRSVADDPFAHHASIRLPSTCCCRRRGLSGLTRPTCAGLAARCNGLNQFGLARSKADHPSG